MIEIIEKIIESEILITSLTFIPEKGATPDEIKQEELIIGKKFSIYHKSFLEKWNGIDLDVIRVYCCGNSSDRLNRIADEQFEELTSKGFTAIGSDPAGFIYLENEKAEIHSFDTDGGEIEFQAKNLDFFFTDLVFGQNADKFLGEDWKEVLRSHNLLL